MAVSRPPAPYSQSVGQWGFPQQYSHCYANLHPSQLTRPVCFSRLCLGYTSHQLTPLGIMCLPLVCCRCPLLSLQTNQTAVAASLFPRLNYVLQYYYCATSTAISTLPPRPLCPYRFMANPLVLHWVSVAYSPLWTSFYWLLVSNTWHLGLPAAVGHL